MSTNIPAYRSGQVAIGSTFHTGQKAPVSGVYAFVKHLDDSACSSVSQAEREIPLSKDETFPPHVKCGGKAVVWKLVRYA